MCEGADRGRRRGCRRNHSERVDFSVVEFCEKVVDILLSLKIEYWYWKYNRELRPTSCASQIIAEESISWRTGTDLLQHARRIIEESRSWCLFNLTENDAACGS